MLRGRDLLQQSTVLASHYDAWCGQCARAARGRRLWLALRLWWGTSWSCRSCSSPTAHRRAYACIYALGCTTAAESAPATPPYLLVPRCSVAGRVLLVLATHWCVGAVEEVVELALVVAIEVLQDYGKLRSDRRRHS